MRYARARLCQHAQLFVIKVDAVGEPDIVARPAEVLHVFKRAHAPCAGMKASLVLRFAKVRVQTHAVLPCKHRLSRRRSAETEKGEQGASATRCIAPKDLSW